MVEASLWSGLSYVLSALSGIIAAPFLIRGLGTGGYGQYVLGLSLIAPLGMMSFGVSAATIRYISEAFAQNDRAAAARIVRNSLFLNIIAGLAGLALFLTFRDVLLAKLFKTTIGNRDAASASTMLTLFAASWPLSQMQGTLAAVDIGRLSFKSWAVKANLTTLVLLSVPVTAAAITRSPSTTAAARLVAVMLCVVLWAVGVTRTLGWAAVRPAGNVQVLRRMAGFSGWQVANDLGTVVNNQADTWVIAARLDTAAVGSMNALFSVTSALSGLIGRLSDSLFPGAARLAADGRRAAAFSAVCGAGRLTSLIVFVPLVSAAWLGSDIGRYLGGDAMARDGAVLLPLLAAGTALSVQSAPLSQFLLGTGGNRWLFPMTLVNGVGGAVITYALASRLGVESMGWATIAMLIVGRVPLQMLSIRSGDRALDTRRFLWSSYGVTTVTVVLCLGAWATAKAGLHLDPLPLRVAVIVLGSFLGAVLAFVSVHGLAVARRETDRVMELARLVSGRVMSQAGSSAA
jgi:O-antigen/teichoic acid export membrane protein